MIESAVGEFPELQDDCAEAADPDDKSSAAADSLTVHVSDQVCEAEKDEDGHALNLKGEDYTLRSTPEAITGVAGAGGDLFGPPPLTLSDRTNEPNYKEAS
jgi:hypothetical protein